LTLSMGESRAEDKPKRMRWSRRNLRWESEFEYFDYTLATYAKQVFAGHSLMRSSEASSLPFLLGVFLI